MKKFIPILTALVISGLLITTLFATGILQIKTEQGKRKIDIKGLTTSSSKNESVTFVQHMEKGDEYTQKGMNALAYNEYLAANQLSPASTAPYMKIGKLLFKNRDYGRAQEIFQQLLAKDPADLEANIYLTRTFIMQRKPEKAKEILGTIQGDSQQKWYYSGILSAYFGQYEDAKKALQEAIILNTDGTITENAKKIMSAFDEFNLNQGSQEIFLKTLLSKTFNQVGEYTLSIPLLYQVVKEKKDYRDAWILLGYAYLNIEDNKNAIDALEEAKKLDKNKPETLFFLGLAYHAAGQKELAAQLIEDAINKGFEPKIQAQQKLAEIYLELKEYEKSAAKYEIVIALNDNDVNYYIRPMWLYIDMLGQPDKALKLAQKAVTKHPESAMAQNLVGWAYLASKDFTNARNTLAKALELDPNLSAAYLNLGKLYEHLSYPDTAKDYYRTAFRLGQGTSIADTAANLYNKLNGTEATVDGNATINTINNLDQSFSANITSPQAPGVSNQKPPTFTLPPLTTAP